MMSIQPTRNRTPQGAALALMFALFVPWGASASPQATIERAAPAVPTPRSTPCEVPLFQDAPFSYDARNPSQYSYAPPPACPPPWAKVVLSMDLVAHDAGINGVAVGLKGVTLFVAPTPSPAQVTGWHVERDLTDYSALFKAAGDGSLDALWGGSVTGSATLRFYPPSAAQPAPRVPDAVFSTYTALLPPNLALQDPKDAIKDLPSLPHNIERAYLDVTANDDAFWYTCITPALLDAHPTLVSAAALGLNERGIFPTLQGCLPNSYSDVGVSVDGTPAGVAPVFPWLPTNFSMNSDGPVVSPFLNALDAPIDSDESLDYVPYRVDLTPFAAILNEAGTHQVALHMPMRTEIEGLWILAPRTANLLVYLDHGKQRVSGAVTYNSLPVKRPQPAVIDGLAQNGDLLQGRVHTRLDRSFEIRGFVDTSHGRVHSVVKQQSSFHNVQQFNIKDALDAEDPIDYREDVWLQSTTQSTSRRTQDGHVLSEDRKNVSYPLELHYLGLGRLTNWYSVSGEADDYDVDLFGGSVSADQRRRVDVTHYRHGLEPYTTRLREAFYGSHRVDPDSGQSSHWQAAHTYVFHDNRGSCYQKALTTRNGMLDGTATGMNCPDDRNHVRWFAHPDGSADGLSWQQF